MKYIFDDDGHISDYGFEVLIKGSGDEITRLELAEHISFCDNCVQKYTDILTEDVLIAPLDSIQKPVMKKIGKKRKYENVRRYFTTAVAAGLTMVMWLGGVFQAEKFYDINRNFNFNTSYTEKITEKSSETFDSMTEKINKIFNIMWEVENHGEK